MASSDSLSKAVAQAVHFLTLKLSGKYTPSTLLKLQSVLATNLSEFYAPSWIPSDPVRGSGRRCMSLSPACLPPRPVWAACTAAGVQWFDWIAMLGNKEFDLFVDPGCVAIRRDDKIITIWSGEPVISAPAPKVSAPTVYTRPGKTFAQQIVEADKEDEAQIFHLLNDEIAAPTWMTPIISQFPMPARSTSPMSSISEHSRCSSRSSNSSSSAFSFASDTASSRTSSSGKSSASSGSGEFKQSRRERARQARVFVDTTKIDVTPYDGGKTTVLTGGVMLGGGNKAPKKPQQQLLAVPNAMSNSNSWRTVRA